MHLMPQFTDLITVKAPPKNRVEKTDGFNEKHLTEPAVMLAYAFHLIEKHPNIDEIEIHPDGEHGKQFDIRSWLEKHGYKLIHPEGVTRYGGQYFNGKRSLLVTLKPGLGDVVAKLDDVKIVAECKGGVINTKHPGQRSKLRRGLCEAVGLLMSRESTRENQFAVVPFTSETEILAKRMNLRCRAAGIEIVLVREDGTIV